MVGVDVAKRAGPAILEVMWRSHHRSLRRLPLKLVGWMPFLILSAPVFVVPSPIGSETVLVVEDSDDVLEPDSGSGRAAFCATHARYVDALPSIDLI